MEKNEKTNIIRSIPGGRKIELPYKHPLEYNNWKSAVSYCNTTYGEEDGKRYKIKKNSEAKNFTIVAKWTKLLEDDIELSNTDIRNGTVR